MTIFNRRNAMIGWAAWSVGKQAMRLKAKGVVPSRGGSGGSGSGKRAVKVGVALAAAAGAVAFWRARHRDSTDHDSLASEEIGTSEE
jgi:uncharacterized protein HemX